MAHFSCIIYSCTNPAKPSSSPSSPSPCRSSWVFFRTTSFLAARFFSLALPQLILLRKVGASNIFLALSITPSWGTPPFKTNFLARLASIFSPACHFRFGVSGSGAKILTPQVKSNAANSPSKLPSSSSLVVLLVA